MTMRAGVVSLAVLLVTACRTVEPMPADGDAGTSVGADTTTGTTTSDTATTATSSTDTMATSGAMTSSETGPAPEPKLCSLAVIDPSTDPATAIDEGDGEDQIPTVIGDALLRNCGCHYTDNVQVGVYIDYKSNKQPLATLADFHGNFMGTFPTGFEMMPAYVAVEERVVRKKPLPMPPHGCGVEGEMGALLMADLELFTQWLAAGAPDGASFP